MEEDRINILIKNSTREVDIFVDKDISIYNLLEEIRGLLIAWGYHENTVKDGFEYIVEEFYEPKK